MAGYIEHWVLTRRREILRNHEKEVGTRHETIVLRLCRCASIRLFNKIYGMDILWPVPKDHAPELTEEWKPAHWFGYRRAECRRISWGPGCGWIDTGLPYVRANRMDKFNLKHIAEGLFAPEHYFQTLEVQKGG